MPFCLSLAGEQKSKGCFNRGRRVRLVAASADAVYAVVAIFLFGLMITILPWLAHNYQQTGQIAFDAPFQYRVIASQYAYSGNLDIDHYDFEGKGLGRVLIEFALKDPAFVFGFITNHFLATQIHGVLVLPLIKPYNGIFE